MRDAIIGMAAVLLYAGLLISIATFVSQVLDLIGPTIPVVIVVAITVFRVVAVVYRIIEEIIKSLK